MEIFNVFLCSQTGIIVFAVISIMQTIIKPIFDKFSFSKNEKLRKIILPWIVLILSCLGSLLITPETLVTIGAKLMYGAGVGILSNYLYSNSGLSSIIKRLLPKKETK